MQVRYKLTVKGYVQGVGYRYFCHRKAAEYDICGYARNLPDGSVELDIEGEKSLIVEFINDLKIGPMNASVKAVMAEELPYESIYTEFKIY
jgi:acylphosphatase